MKVVQIFIACLGRILISLIFICAAIGHILDWQGSLQLLSSGLRTWSGYVVGMSGVQSVIDMLLAHVSFAMGTAVVFMLLGGLLVFFGIKTRFGAFLLLLFLIAVTTIMHAFWILHTPDRELQMTMFMKNLSIMGGVFYLLAFGNGGSKKTKSAPPEKK